MLAGPQSELFQAYKQATDVQAEIENDLERQIKALTDEMKRC